MPAEDIIEFKIWANSLGIPVDKIPNDEHLLNRIFRSPQGMVLFNFVQRVHPKQKVLNVKQNLLIARLKKYENQIIPSTLHPYLPKQMRDYLQHENLIKRKKSLEKQFEEKRTTYEKLARSIKGMSIQKIQLQHKRNELIAKKTILEVKSDHFDKSIAEEELTKEKILSNIPVKIRQDNISEKNAWNVVQEALKHLEEFYAIFFLNSNSTQIDEAKNTLWKNVRKSLASTPNYLLWNILLKIKENQVNCIRNISKEAHDNSKIDPQIYFSKLQIEMLQLKAVIIVMEMKTEKIEQDVKNLEEDFIPPYTRVVEALKNRIECLENVDEDEIDDMVNDFMTQYTMKSLNLSKSDFLLEEIQRYQQILTDGEEIAKENQLIIGNTQNVYSESDLLMRKIQDELTQLHQMKDKLRYNKSLMQYKLDESKRNECSFNVQRVRMSNSIDAMEMTDNILCSTKLDFDNTVMSQMSLRLESSIKQNKSVNILEELSIFMQIPAIKLRKIPYDCYFQYGVNPLLLQSTEIDQILQLIPGHVLTPVGVLREIERTVWSQNEIKNFTKDLQIEMQLVEFDDDKFQKLRIVQSEKMFELIDKMEVITINTNRCLRRANKYYKFLIENPLKNLIPSKKLFNSRTYADYEAEFLMYYRMATSTMSAK